jgi:hypothetical protein
LKFLAAQEDFANQLQQEVMGTALSSLASSLMMESTALGDILNLLTANPSSTLGSIMGMGVSESTQNLLMADMQILQMLNTMANGSSPSTSGIRPAVGNGCLGTEAAAAVADAQSGNATAFGNDIELLFEDSVTSPACKNPAAAIATLDIVNGAGAVALAIIAEASNPSVQSLLPTAAILLANLAPAGQLLGIGISLAQTTPQALQMVQNAIEAFNQAFGGELTMAVSQSQGPLNTSFTTTSQTATSFNAATPPPLDGTYAGNFTGTQILSACPGGAGISGSLGFSVQGSTITVTAPGAGSGALNPETGVATFQPGSGIGGPNVTCSFGGILLPSQTAPASASGTWSCSSMGSGSGFISANGTWTAAMQ